MTKIDKISVAITREQHAKIKAAVERGDYATTSEVVRTALREWELKEELRRIEGERIGRLWDEGIASGPSVDGPPVRWRGIVPSTRQCERSQTRSARSRRHDLSPSAGKVGAQASAITSPRTARSMQNVSSSG